MLPLDEMGSELVGIARDQWGNPLSYDLKNNKRFLISSLGPDGILYTVDDVHLTIDRNVQTEEEKRIAASASGDLFASLHPEMTWLDSRREEIGALSDTGKNQEGAASAPEDFSTNVTIGGGENLSGAAYFWFFAQLMLVTAVLFVIVAWFYQPREYLQEEAAA